MAGNRPSEDDNTLMPPGTSSNSISDDSTSDDNLRRHLHMLLREGHLSKIQEYLDRHRNLNLNVSTPGPKDSSKCDLLLHQAFSDKLFEAVELLLERGAMVDTFCCKGRNAIQCAASCNSINARVLECLTRNMEGEKAKLYINSSDEDRDRVALHYLCDQENTTFDEIHSLQAAGANLTMTKGDRVSLRNRRESQLADDGIHSLQAAGANLIKTNRHGKTALDLALEKGNWFSASELARLLWDMKEGEVALAARWSKSQNWVEISRQNTVLIQSIITDQSLQECNILTRRRILECITLDFRHEGKPNDPVGNGGRESACFSRKVDDFNFMAISVPFFSSKTSDYIKQRKNICREHISTLEGYSNKDYDEIGLQCVSTLNEYCLPSLDESAMMTRNKNQVLSRYEKGLSPELSWGKAKILTVPQLWVYTIEHPEDNKIKMYTAMEKDVESAFDLHAFNIMYKFFGKVSSSQGLQLSRSLGEMKILLEDLYIGALISECVNSLSSRQFRKPTVTIFDIYKRSIFKLSATVQDHSSQEVPNNGGRSIGTYFVLQIGNIREELSMIQSVLAEQEQVWRQFIEAKFSEFWDSEKDLFVIREQHIKMKEIDYFSEAMEILKRPQVQFAHYKRRIAILDENADRVQSSITLLLDLQSQAIGLREARMATSIGAAVIGFSIVTIVFTPLSFLSSLFALPINHLQSHQSNSALDNGAPVYNSSYVAKWMGTTGAVSLIITLFLTWVVLKLLTDFGTKDAMKIVLNRIEKPMRSVKKHRATKREAKQERQDEKLTTEAQQDAPAVDPVRQQSNRRSFPSMFRNRPVEAERQQNGNIV